MSNSDIADLLIEMFNGKQEASQIGNGLVSHFDLLQKLNFKIENNHEDN